MALPTAEDTTSTEGPLTSLQKTKPQFSILGSKVGALSEDTSGDIKAKLQEMIAAREAEKTGFGALAEGLAPYAGSSDQWANNRRAVNETKQQRDQDIASMRLGIANLDAQQKQQALEAQDIAAQNARLTGTGGTGTTGAAQGQLPPQVVANINAMRRLDPAKALTMEHEAQKVFYNPEYAKLQDYVVGGKTYQVPLSALFMKQNFGVPIPGVDAPQAANPQPTTPQPATPQAATPQAATPQAATPQAATPQMDNSKEAAALGMKQGEADIERQKASLVEEDKAANALQTAWRNVRADSDDLSAKIGAVMPGIAKFPTIVGSQSVPGVVADLANSLSARGTKNDSFWANMLERRGIPKGPNQQEAIQTLTKVNQIYDQAGALKGKELFGSGQGETDKDLAKAMSIVGNPRLLNATSLVASLKVMQAGISFKNGMIDRFDELRNQGSKMTFADFQRTPEYKAAEQMTRKGYVDALKQLSPASEVKGKAVDRATTRTFNGKNYDLVDGEYVVRK